MDEKIIEEKKRLLDSIHGCRIQIAELQEKKINHRAESWSNATGVADEKKDYVRSQVSDLQSEIDKLEADIERYYGLISVLEDKLCYE